MRQIFPLLAPLLTSITLAVDVRQTATQIVATWPADNHTYRVTLNVDPTQPLLAELSVDETQVATDLDLTYRITTGTRLEKPNTPYIFFDYPIEAKNGPVNHYDAKPTRDKSSLDSTPDHTRTTITVGTLSAGPFTGHLLLHLYDNSPFLHVEASLSPDADRVAYAYEPLVTGSYRTICYTDPSGEFHRDAPGLPARPLKVKYRTVVAETAGGSVALFPPPHAFIFPRDYSTNFGFAQTAPNTIGLRNDLSSGNKFVPWADAPKGRAQRMSAFLLFSNDSGENAIDRVTRYTHGDSFPKLPGRVTFISHLHPEITVAEMSGKPTAPALKHALVSAGVNIFHLAEFHGRGHSFDTGKARLDELRAMFDLCAKYSDDRFLLIPGEEANAYLPGHWVYMFPKPTYLTMKPTPGKPAVEGIPPYGTVHHPQNETEIMKLIADQGGLAWTTHPRIKGSEHCPDLYKDRDWYKSPTWLGGTWKNLPTDLSQPHLGNRSFELLDDMNTWPGAPKYMPSEIDTFDLDPTHEFYGHASVNYLHLPDVPKYGDFTPVINCLRHGDFFTTTGEVLLHDVRLNDDNTLSLEASWTLPLSHAILTTYDGSNVRHTQVPAPRPEFGKSTLTLRLPADRPLVWYRVELWDVALNGAYTQPTYLAR